MGGVYTSVARVSPIYSGVLSDCLQFIGRVQV